MDWLKSWNNALDYLEEHLDGEINTTELGRLTGCSPYHFQRMFSYLAGIPLNEYIRRRRMTLAAADLRAGEKVLNVALRYGYDSPTAFNRAFQSIHGAPPSLAKQDGVKLKAFPRIHFKFVVKGATEMEYQIVQKPALRIVGFRTPIPMDQEESFQCVPQFWAETGHRLGELIPLMDQSFPGVLGVCTMDKENYYYIAVASDAVPPDGGCSWTIPAATWAVFSGQGPSPAAIQELQKRVVSEWLPDSGYEWAPAPDIEVYLTAPDAETAQFQIWVPVTKRK